MKKILTSTALIVLLLSNAVTAQIIFSEDFDGVPGTTSGGPGTYVFPAGWLLRNVDNRTPDSSVSYVNDAWERRKDWANNVNDSCAFSTSWYSPAGAADDWMWTPLIGPITARSIISWNATTYDPLYPDGYEVRVMTVASGPPTGGTGNIGNQVTNSAIVFSIAAESSTWTSHELSLAAYAGQSIYIGFRNNSNDQFLLLIDDVVVEHLLDHNAAVTSPDTASQYTSIPNTQIQPVVLGAGIKNRGMLAVTNVRLKADIMNKAGTTVYSATSSAMSSLAPLTTSHFSVTSFMPPPVAETYSVLYTCLINETDSAPANDTLTVYNTMSITINTYARDDGRPTAELGIGAGTVGYLGQQFDIVNPDFLTSVSFHAMGGHPGGRVAVAIWDMSAGKPNQAIASTDTIIFPDNAERTYTLPMHNGPFFLTTGIYAITVIEFDSMLRLAQTNKIFTPATTWVDWPGNPLGGWANNEDFGTNFAKPYMIRPNLLGTSNYNTIKGICFIDNNHNGVQDGGEPGYNNVMAVSTGSSRTYSSMPDAQGLFFNYTIDTGTVITTLNNLQYYTSVPVQHTSNFGSFFNTDSVSFALSPVLGIQDLRISMFPLNPLRLGRDISYRVQYSNVGTDAISGNIFMVKDRRTSFVAANPIQTSINGDSISWSYSSLQPNESRMIEVTLSVGTPPAVNIGDLLSSSVVIEPVATDTTPGDNRACVCEQPIIGSYDPNDKAMISGTNFSPVQVAGGEYLTYMIRFQNTGNDTAFKVVVRDTLDSKIDGTSFEMVSSSHNYTVSVENGRFVTWTFDNILLPDSNIDEPGSHGYICYRVKAMSSVMQGQAIENTAHIYFDYNAAVATNTVTTGIEFPVATPVLQIADNGFYLFPNPVKGNTTIGFQLSKAAEVTIIINNLLGETTAKKDFSSLSSGSHEILFDTQNFPAGIYFVNVVIDGNSRVKKMVKME